MAQKERRVSMKTIGQLFSSFILIFLLITMTMPAESIASEREDIQNAINTMIKALKEGNDGIRNRMFFQLRDFGVKAEASLIKNYEISDDPDVKQYITKTLGWVGGEKTLEFLSKVLKGGSPEMRQMAASSLGTLGNKKAVPALCEALKDSNMHVRINAATSLGLLEDKSAIPALKEAFKNSKEGKYFIKSALETLKAL